MQVISNVDVEVRVISNVDVEVRVISNVDADVRVRKFRVSAKGEDPNREFGCRTSYSAPIPIHERW